MRINKLHHDLKPNLINNVARHIFDNFQELY